MRRKVRIKFKEIKLYSFDGEELDCPIKEQMENTNKLNKSFGSKDSIKQPFFVLHDISVCKDITLKDRFKVLLLRRGISQNKLAEEIGITAQTLSNIINGHWIPTSQIKLNMSKALDVDSLVLFGAKEYWKDWREKVGYPKVEEENDS